MGFELLLLLLLDDDVNIFCFCCWKVVLLGIPGRRGYIFISTNQNGVEGIEHSVYFRVTGFSTFVRDYFCLHRKDWLDKTLQFDY